MTVGNHRIDAASLGGNRVSFREPVLLEASHGEVVLRVDGCERRWAIEFQQPSEPVTELQADFRLLESSQDFLHCA